MLVPVMICMISGCLDKSSILRIDGSQVNKGELTRNIQSLVDTARVTGMGISIFNEHEVVYQKAFGVKDANTKDTLGINSICYGASLSKAVFSFLVMQMVDEGMIELDRPLREYLDKPLPEYNFNRSWRGYKDLKGDLRYEEITARMCLSHTTGLPNWRFLTKSGFDINGKLFFQFEPGARYSYSGEGFSLLQFVVEEIAGKGLEDMAQDRIFQPLQMDRTSYLYVLEERYKNDYIYGHDLNEKVIPFDEANEAGAAGSMGTTLADYSKFMEAILKQQILSKERWNEMFTQQVKIRSKQQFGPDALIQTTVNEDINLGYGLGWGLLESPYGFGAFKEGHADGFQHYSILFPDKGIGVLIMSNSDNAESIFKEVLKLTIADIYTPWEWENYVPYQN